MKTAISIPDTIFSQAERYAKNNGMTRSQLFTVAVRHYVESNQHNEITEKLDEIYGESDGKLESGFQTMQSLSLENEEW
jgi:metal-responsive CopG/Arc/MetJ family transcriptional regulator